MMVAAMSSGIRCGMFALIPGPSPKGEGGEQQKSPASFEGSMKGMAC